MKEKLHNVWTTEKKDNLRIKISNSYDEKRRNEVSNRFLGKCGPKLKLSYNDVKKIKKLRLNGETYKNIANMFDVSSSCIIRAVKNPLSKSRNIPRTVITINKLEMIREMRFSKSSYKTIASSLGVSIGAVRNFLKRHGVK